MSELVKELEELHEKYMHKLEVEKRYDLSTLIKMGQVALAILVEENENATINN